MATAQQIEAHDQLIQDSLATTDSAIQDASKAVEQRLAETILQFQSPDQLINERARLDRAFDPLIEFAQTVPETTSAIASDAISMQGIGDRDSQDTVTETALNQVSQNEVLGAIQEQRTAIVDSLVVAAVAGTAITQIAQESRFRVSGLMADTDNTQARRLQTQLRNLRERGGSAEEIRAVQTQLRTALGAPVAATANLTENIKRRTQDTVMRFQSAFTASRAKRKGVTKYRYEGGVQENSRDFCRSLDGEVLTEDEIQSIWDRESWTGKEPGDPFVVRGGYNCRHFWVPVEE